MAHFLLPSTPLYGHLLPILTLGRGLRARGHDVTVLTGTDFRYDVRRHSLGFFPLPAAAGLTEAVGGRRRSRLAAGRRDILDLFVGPLAAQHDGLLEALRSTGAEAIIAETGFLGVLPTLLTKPPGARLPVLGLSTTPLALVSADAAPFGSGVPPGRWPFGSVANRLLNTALHHGPLRSVQRALDAALAAYGVPAGAVNYFDVVTRFDSTFHLAPPGIEYPRRELPAHVACVGPLRPADSIDRPLPSWWPELEGGRPVVHVTQGTMDNLDLGKLIVPAVRALAERDVLVVVTTGGRPVDELTDRLGGPLPAHVRVEEFLPYGALLARTEVMITNGGFGGVQRALSAGVPLVVAGASEDKPEVAARVSWSGAGVDLRTGRPSAGRLRRAVDTVLGDDRYFRSAQRLASEIADLGDPLPRLIDAAEDAVRLVSVGRRDGADPR